MYMYMYVPTCTIHVYTIFTWDSGGTCRLAIETDQSDVGTGVSGCGLLEQGESFGKPVKQDLRTCKYETYDWIWENQPFGTFNGFEIALTLG